MSSMKMSIQVSGKLSDKAGRGGEPTWVLLLIMVMVMMEGPQKKKKMILGDGGHFHDEPLLIPDQVTFKS